MVDKHLALAREEIIEALTSYTGITTADGATPGNNTLIDSLLIGKNDFITGKTILIGAGYDTSYEDKGAQSFNNVTGTITFTAGFSHQIKQGTIYRVLNLSSSAQVSTLLNAIQTGLGRKYTFLDFWSTPEDKLTITNVAQNITFPDIVVAGLPGGLTIQRVVLMFMCRAINNVPAVANYINAAGKTLRIKKSTGTWGVNDVVGITFDQNSLYCAASMKESGLPIIGSVNLSATVDGDATYNVMSNQTARGDALVAAAASLELYDVQVGLRVFFS